jgi:multidrug efflux system membrane fusion protein
MAAARRFRWQFIIPAVLLAAIVAWLIFGHKAPAKPTKPPAVSVSVAKVGVQDIPVSITALGAAQAWRGVVVRTQVNGVLLRVDFTEGTEVSAGQVLAEIDPAPYHAALLQAQGALMRDQALLAAAKVDLARYQTLAAQDSIAHQQVDTQAALVKQDEGLVLIDQGSVAAAQFNLRNCRIVSPVNGRVGVRLIDPGNVVSTSDTTGLVTVNQIEPIAVTFTVPQGDFQGLVQASNGFTKPMAVEALSQETGQSLGLGQISIADNHVDPATGTVALKAQFANPAKQLWPGQFVNVRLTLQTLSQAVTVPAAAVNQGPRGAYAYVVGADNKVAVRPLTVATTQDGVAVIKSGLKPGETVVIDGQMVLRDKSMIAVHPQAKKPGA